MGNDEQVRYERETVRSARRFLAASTGSRAGSRVRTCDAVGRGEWAAGVPGHLTGRRGESSEREIEAGLAMSRTAQDVLEFDKLRELLRLRTTCAPGQRAVNALEPGTNRAALESRSEERRVG